MLFKLNILKSERNETSQNREQTQVDNDQFPVQLGSVEQNIITVA